MPDPANTGGGNPTVTTVAPVQTDYQVPEGKVLADANEFAVLKQNNERVRGMQPYWEAGSKYGIKKPEDFESVGKWRKFEESLKAKGMTTEQIMAAFENPEPEQSGGGVDMATIEKQFGEKFVPTDKFTQELDFRDAMRDHKSASDRESALLKSAVAELAGENASARDKWLIENAVKGYIGQNPNFYPEKHPLSEKEYAPRDEKGVAALVEAVKKNLAESEGTDMAKLGKQAAKSKSIGTPAGNRAGQGKPDDTETTTPRAQIRSAVERAMGGSG